MEMNNPIEACKFACRNYEGCIIEIGAGLGETTKQLLPIAAYYDRLVIVIDPFERGWAEMPHDYGKPYTLSGFHDNVKGHKDNLIIHQYNSLAESSEKMCEQPIAFAFIDGLQYKGAVLNDLRIVSHAKVICVDDMDRMTGESQVPQAVHEFIKQTGKHLTIKDRWAIIT